jgi:hypothetical protein
MYGRQTDRQRDREREFRMKGSEQCWHEREGERKSLLKTLGATGIQFVNQMFG